MMHRATPENTNTSAEAGSVVATHCELTVAGASPLPQMSDEPIAQARVCRCSPGRVGGRLAPRRRGAPGDPRCTESATVASQEAVAGLDRLCPS